MATVNVNSGSGIPVKVRNDGTNDQQVVVLGIPSTDNDIPTDATLGLAVQNVASSQVDGHSVTIGAKADAEAASGSGSVVAVLKRLRTLLNGGLPAALVGGRLSVTQDGVTASAPLASQLSDGAASYTGTKTGQLPTALDANGNLKIAPQSVAVLASATVAQVASSASNTTLLFTDSTAKARSIYNDSNSVLYVKHGTTASASSYTTQVPSQSNYEFPLPLFTGRVDGYWTTANGNALVTQGN